MTSIDAANKKIIIAGPNGAGKCHAPRSFLPAEARLPHFINADLLVAGLAPFAPETVDTTSRKPSSSVASPLD